MPDELLRNIMQYAGLAATTALSRTCTTVKNLVNYDAIGRGAVYNFITGIYYHKYPDDDDVVEMAREVDTMWTRLVQLRGDKDFCRYVRVTFNLAFVDDHRHTMNIMRHSFDQSTFRWKDHYPENYNGEPTSFMLSRQLPLTRADTYLAHCCAIIMAIETVLNHDVWTILPTQKTRLRLLLENDLSITRPDTVIDIYLSKSEEVHAVCPCGHTNVADLPA